MKGLSFILNLCNRTAEEKGLQIAGAPDTYLGASFQTCRKLIEDGMIGEVVGFNAAMICRGHESWHPDPAFYYQFGGGPLMDMGPYYLTALVNLLGPVAAVTSVAKTSFSTRTITSQSHAGESIDVEVPTYVAGTLKVTNPNMFGEKIYLLRPESKEYKEMPLLFDYQEDSRGLGLADMAKALQEKRTIRANMHQTFHVLDVITGFQRSSDKKAREVITSSIEATPIMKKATVLGIIESDTLSF